MDLRDVGCDLGDWTDLTEDWAYVKATNKPQGFLKANKLVRTPQ